jgi:hypothetical protein
MNRGEMAPVVVLSRHGSKGTGPNPSLTETGRVQVGVEADQLILRYGKGGTVFRSSTLRRAGESRGILVVRTAPLEVVGVRPVSLDRGEDARLDEPFQLKPGMSKEDHGAEWQAFWTKHGYAFPNDGPTLAELGDRTFEVVRVPQLKYPENSESPGIRTLFAGHSGNLLAFALSDHVEPYDPFQEVRDHGSEALERVLPPASWVEFTRNGPSSPYPYRVTRVGRVELED